MAHTPNRLSALVRELVIEGKLMRFTLSDPVDRTPGAVGRISGRPVAIRGCDMWQIERRARHGETHENVEPRELPETIANVVPEVFRQGVIHAADGDYQLSTSAKGSLRISRRPATQTPELPKHDRQKQYILPEGVPCDFLARLGLMTAEGRVIAAKYDKFRQVNRFLEMVADVAGELPAEGPLTVVDFGSGKSYLTFALHHFLTQIRNREVRIVGLDLKADVVEHCNAIARDLKCHGLEFTAGDIASYRGLDSVDMVVSLHACDTATDDALARAIEWKAHAILAVPCCQHEVFRQINNGTMRPMLKHGIVRERLSALVTDSLRAQLLEIAGYAVQILEFVESQHTPKNLLLRAVRRERKPTRSAWEEYLCFRDSWGVQPYLERRLAEIAAVPPFARGTAGSLPPVEP